MNSESSLNLHHIPSPNPNESTSSLTLDQLPNELLQSILSYLKLQQLLQLRLVCTRWQNVIESMQQQNRCLILTDSDISEEEEQLIKSRFFGKINLSDFVCFKLKLKRRNAELNEYFGTLLQRLFPLIEQLLINTIYDPNLRFVLSLWPVEQITTLSIEGTMVDTHKHDELDLANRINSLTSLRRLDLVGCARGFLDTMLLPTFDRIEHFSCHYGEYTDYHQEDEVHELIGDFGSNCSYLWINNLDLDSDFILQWHSINPQWLTRVTHLKMNIENEFDEILRYFGERATSLQVLHINSCYNSISISPQILGYLKGLANLTELNFSNVSIENFNEWKKVKVGNPNLVQLTSVQTVSLNPNIKATDPGYNENVFNVVKRALLNIFPNVQNFSLLNENV